MVSIILPARNEKFLQKTIDCLVENATGEYEIIAGLDGYWPNPPLKDHPNVNLLHMPQSVGMRSMINSLVDIAHGQYIMKIDAHCNIGKGFDETLVESCDENTVCAPRQYSLHDDTWTRNRSKKVVDYYYIEAPAVLKEEEKGNRNLGFQVQRWYEYSTRPGIPEKRVDDLMGFQGSCWFMTKNHFYNIEMNDPKSLHNFSYEAVEISLRTWLSGGKVLINKNTWFAHLHKGKKHGRGYFIAKGRARKAAEYCIDLFMNEKWPKMVHNVQWLVEKFAPPTWENFDWGRTW